MRRIGTAITSSRNAKFRRGVAAVEFALTAPLLLLFLLGIWEMGRVVDVEQMLNNAAAQGGRQASTGVYTNAQVQSMVVNYLAMAGLPTQDVVVTVSDLTNPGTDVSQATQLDQLQVSVTIPYSDVRWTTASLVMTPTTLLKGQAVWYSAMNAAYPSNISVPSGY